MVSPKMSETSIKKYFYKTTRDIGMAAYEKLVKQELPYPIPILLFCNWCITECYQTKWFHGGYKNRVICYPYIPLHFVEVIFILVLLIFSWQLYISIFRFVAHSSLHLQFVRALFQV